MEEFTFCRFNLWYTLPFLFAVQALKNVKNVRDGAQAYLVYVQAKPETQVKLKDIPVVRHYSNVFFEVPGLPLDHEVEFSIDLVSRTQLIHKAPYHMAPTELRELKEQLQELLDRGFIRPSVYHHGSVGVVCEEEGRAYADVYRLQ
jgi:hypothetical protein